MDQVEAEEYAKREAAEMKCGQMVYRSRLGNYEVTDGCTLYPDESFVCIYASDGTRHTVKPASIDDEQA